MRFPPVALGLAILVAGCATTPEYSDPLASMTTPVVKECPFANQTLRVLMSDNTQRAFRHVDEARGARMGMEPGSRPAALTPPGRAHSVAFTTSPQGGSP